MRPGNLLTCLTLLATVSSAFEWPSLSKPLEVVKHEVAPLLRRQNNNNDNNQSQDQQSSAAPSQTGDNNNNDNNNDNQASSSAQDQPKETASSSAGGDGDKKTTTTNGDGDKKTTEASTKTKTFDPRLPAGGVSMVTPNIMSGAQYYKIKDYVTFAWNFTSLSVTPTALDIMATCTTNSALYTIAVNQTVAGKTQAVTWDTNQYYSTPLLVATYTLIIYDADSSISASPQAGYLGVYDQFTFGMYTPQPYVPIKDYVCATCNSANSGLDRHTWKFLLGMVAVTVLSFGWFAGVAGLW